MVINLQLSGNVSVVSYCVVPKETEDAAGKLLHQFLNETDEWRNGRFKLLPHIVEGGYIVKKMVGVTPCLIGTKGESAYYKVTMEQAIYCRVNLPCRTSSAISIWIVARWLGI